MLTGSCCCKKIKFTLKEAPSLMGTCHCSRCRKLGASVMVFIKKDSLEVTKGNEFIKTYHPEEGFKYKRDFCANCGSALGEITSYETSFPIPANLIDDDMDLENSFHEFVSEKPDWIKICDEAKQFFKHPR
ncbi:GFA family protein [Halobacteriovorax sp. XZX-3]|uniref:GFA family protein n=1 Tax=unclassified Halobacteriovorax TaxID=2639665 RepID=UPI003723B377